VPIIDFRLRPPLRGFLDMVMYANAQRRDAATRRHGFEPAPSAVHQSMELLLKEMDSAGISAGVVVGRNSGLYGSVDNDAVAAIVADHPGRFIGVASIDPTRRRAACDEIDRAMTLGLRAVNIEPGAYAEPMKADDRRLYPIYGHCEDAGIPVIMMVGGSAGPDLSYTDPIHFDRVAGDFPALRIVASHGGWPWVDPMIHIAYRRPNVYLSPDQYLANMPGTREYLEAARGFLKERFLYASSYPFLPVDSYCAWFLKQPMSDEVRERVMYRNAAELLGLEGELRR
jgi:predicted TIM-barrel fold metal-dependent hydrolase